MMSSMNLPNKLTILRVIMIPFYVIFQMGYLGGEAAKYVALTLFIIASLTDFLDGKIGLDRHHYHGQGIYHQRVPAGGLRQGRGDRRQLLGKV